MYKVGAYISTATSGTYTIEKEFTEAEPTETGPDVVDPSVQSRTTVHLVVNRVPHFTPIIITVTSPHSVVGSLLL